MQLQLSNTVYLTIVDPETDLPEEWLCQDRMTEGRGLAGSIVTWDYHVGSHRSWSCPVSESGTFHKNIKLLTNATFEYKYTYVRSEVIWGPDIAFIGMAIDAGTTYNRTITMVVIAQ